MPQAVNMVINAARAVAAYFAQNGAARAVVRYAVRAAWAYGVNSLLAKATGSRGLSGLAQGREIATEGGAYPHEIIYGIQKTAGHAVDHHAWRAGGGAGKNNRYARVQCLAGHPCAEIEKVMVNGRPVIFHPVTGEVYTAPYTGKLWIFVHTGEPDQVVNPNFLSLTEGWWTASKRGKGRTWIGWVMKANNKAFSSGIPQISARVRGKKVYDPRKDSTNGGTGSHLADDPQTWEFSDNAALCAADHYRSEYGIMQNFAAGFPGRVLPLSYVNWPSVITAANISDETCPAGEGVEAKYRCWGRFFADDDPYGVFEQIKLSMAGRHAVGGSVLTLYAGAYYAPSVSLNGSHLDGDVSIQFTRSRENSFSGVKGSYNSPDHEFRPTSYPSVKSPGFVGEPVYLPLDQNFTPSPYQAQRIAQIIVNRAAFPRLISTSLNMRGLELAAGHTVSMDLPPRRINNVDFEVESWGLTTGELRPQFPVTLRETAPEIYAGGTLATSPPPLVLPDLDNDLIPPPVPVITSLTSVAGAGYYIEFQPPEDVDGVALFQIYETLASSADPVGEGSLQIQVSQNNATRVGLSSGDTRFVHVRAIGTNGLYSDFAAEQEITVSAIANGNIEDFTDEAHGARGGGDLHELATDVVAGFMSPTDKARLDALADDDAILEEVRTALGDLSGLGGGDPGAAPATYSEAWQNEYRARLEALIEQLSGGA